MFDETLAKGKSTLETVTTMHWWTEYLFTFTTQTARIFLHSRPICEAWPA